MSSRRAAIVLVELARQLRNFAWRLEEFNLLTKDLGPDDLAPRPPAGGWPARVELLDQDTPRLRELMARRYVPPRADPGAWLAKMRHRFLAGSLVYVLVREGRPLGWIWRNSRSYLIEPLDDLRPRPREAVFYDVYLLPEARGQGFYRDFFRRAAAAEARAGNDLLSLVVAGANRASLAAHHKAGLERIALKHFYLRCLGLTRQARQPGPFPLARELAEPYRPGRTLLLALGLGKAPAPPGTPAA
ncbi:MAG: GNAT family N-acetyltransferase [Deltaproteobacteria bacterium]|nr:GNAT family N-acetyltransferase [Deltaproteobacteria bacterium]